MFINPRIDALGLAPLAHGGDLTAARRLFPDAPQPFIDLSTGINPHPYPLPPLPGVGSTGRPEGAAVTRLEAAAARPNGVPSEAAAAPAPGTKILLTQVAALVPPGRAAILGPTYAEHKHAARLLGHEAVEVY